MANRISKLRALPYFVYEDIDAGCFAAYCPALNLYSAGVTEAEAGAAMDEAIGMHVRITTERYERTRS